MATMSELSERFVDSPWLVRFRNVVEPEARIVCFPFGGGSAAYFARWAWRAGDTVDLVAVQYPGRCSRASEPALVDFSVLVDSAARAIVPLLDHGKVVFFGHSFGALVAFEVAHLLSERGLNPPQHLFVSARGAPGDDQGNACSELGEEDLRALVRRLDGMSEEAMADERLMASVIPALRADLMALGTWHYKLRPPLAMPVTAMGGSEDRDCRVECLDVWKKETSSKFTRRVFSGGHFYLNRHSDAVLGMLLDTAGLELPRPRPRRVVPAFTPEKLRQASGGARA
ncbi:Surfactin synthase thioesterase subunit [Mesorhizobium sp. YR577]|nr:Surfactin synthase thioesterase subunit [Mesorhizobium sp. YR577]